MEDRNGDFSDVCWNLIGVQTTQTCQSNSASNFLWSLLFENEDEGLKLFWYYDLVPGLFIFNASHTTLSRCGSHKRRWKIGPISDACPPITFKALIVNKGFENTWTLLKTWVGGRKSEVKSEVRPVPPGRYGRIIWARHLASLRLTIHPINGDAAFLLSLVKSSLRHWSHYGVKLIDFTP